MIKALSLLDAYGFAIIAVYCLLIPSAYKIGALESEAPVRNNWLVSFMITSCLATAYFVLMPLVVPLQLAVTYFATAMLVTLGAVALVGLLILMPPYKIVFTMYTLLWTIPFIMLYEFAKHLN